MVMEKASIKNILIIGSYGASNLGDEALLEALLTHTKVKIKKFVLSGNIKDTLKRHPKADAVALHFPFGLRSFFSFGWFKSFVLLRKADLVLLGGGGLFADHETPKAVALWSWQVLWVKLLRKRLVILGNSIGPLKTYFGRKTTAWALRQAEEIYVRDQNSLQWVQNLAPKTPMHLSSDLAFLNKKPETAQKKKQIALNIRPWNCSVSLAPLIAHYKKKGYSILLIPMEEQDRILLEQYEDEGVKIIFPDNYESLLQLLNTCEAALGMRLHFLIAAAIADCKVAGISYSSKVDGMMELLELPHQTPQELTEKTVIDLMGKAKKAMHVDEQRLKAKEMLKELNLS